MVRPEQIRVTRRPEDGELRGEVISFEYYGHDAVLRIRPDSPLVNEDGSRIRGRPGPQDRVGPTDGAEPSGTSAEGIQPEPDDVVVRVTGGSVWSVGTHVGLVGQGPVRVWRVDQAQPPDPG
jgi:hypothetical protein